MSSTVGILKEILGDSKVFGARRRPAVAIIIFVEGTLTGTDAGPHKSLLLGTEICY